MIVLRRVDLFINLGDLHTKLTFDVVETLSVFIFIGMIFIGKYVKIIYPAARKLMPKNSRAIAVLSTETSEKLATATASATENIVNNLLVVVGVNWSTPSSWRPQNTPQFNLEVCTRY